MSKNINIYKRLKTTEQARILYNVFHGECFFLEDYELKEFVISNMPDASGCIGEDSDGKESFKKINDIFVREELFERIKDKYC